MSLLIEAVAQRLHNDGDTTADNDAFVGVLNLDGYNAFTNATSINIADVVVGVLVRNDTIYYIANGASFHSDVFSDTGYGAGATKAKHAAMYLWSNNATGYADDIYSFLGRTVRLDVHGVYYQQSADVSYSNYFAYDAGGPPAFPWYSPAPAWYNAANADGYVSSQAVTFPMACALVRWYDGAQDSAFQSIEYYEVNYKRFWAGVVNCEALSDFYVMGLDQDALAIFERMTTEAPPENMVAINALVTGLKNAGLWTRLDSLYVPVGAHDQQAGLLDWKRDGVSAVLHGSAVWSAQYGFVGATGSGSYIESKYDPAVDSTQYTQNNCSVGCYLTMLASGASLQYYFGDSGDIAPYIALAHAASGARFYTLGPNNSLAQYTPNDTEAVGLVSLDRSASNRWDVFLNGVSIDSGADASSGLASSEMYILAMRGSGGTAYYGAGARMAVWYAGSSFSAVEQANIKALIDDYMAALV